MTMIKVRRGAQFLLWAVVGAGAILSLLTILTIGVFVLPATAALAGILVWRGDRLAWPGLLAGLGLVPVLRRLPEPRRAGQHLHG